MPDFHAFWRLVQSPSLLELQSIDGSGVIFIAGSIFEETCFKRMSDPGVHAAGFILEF